MRFGAVILAALLTPATVLGASNVLSVYQAGDAGGTIFDGQQPRTSPKECYVVVAPSGEGREITVATDQPFRARMDESFVAGSGAKYKAISVRVPLDLPAAGEKTTLEDGQGYLVEYSAEKKSKWVEQGAVARLVIKYDGEESGILKDVAEISLTAEFAPVYAEVEALTRFGTLNKRSKIKCEEFSKAELERSDVAGLPGDPAAASGLPAHQETFWRSLQDLCGKSYAHVQEPPVPSRPILDVRSCDEESVAFGVHYLAGSESDTWNRSQVWVVSRAADGFRMEYSMTESDAPGAKSSGWTAATKDTGNEEIQVFLPDEEALEATPGLENFGWVVRIHREAGDLATFLYEAVEKTDAGEQSRGGYLFDLSATIPSPEDPPWGLASGAPEQAPVESAGVASPEE